jgi:hypothetical protein
MKTIFKAVWDFLKGKRMKSFYWRVGVMFFTAVGAAFSDSGLTGPVVVVIGLFLAEGTKWMNNYITENGL